MNLKADGVETEIDRLRREALIQTLALRRPGPDGLTEADRILLVRIQVQGAEFERTFMVEQKDGPGQQADPLRL